MRSEIRVLLLLLVGLSCFSCQSCLAQDQFAAKFDRLRSTLNIVRLEAKLKESNLELVEEQKQQIAEMRKRHQEIVKAFIALSKEEKSSKRGKEAILNKFALLEDELTTKILLPHQANALEAKVFWNYLKLHKGNLAKTILTNYPDELGLTESQISKMKGVETDVLSRLKEAKEKFEKEVEEIRKSAKNSISEVLTKKQLDQILDLEGNIK